MGFKIRNSRDLKYFVYLSETKLKMLFKQIAQGDGKTTLEWKLSMGAASVLRKVETPDDVDKYDMLNAVTKYLEDAGQVGTVYVPNIYIRGILPMRWGMYDDAQQRPSGQQPLVYFGSLDSDSKVLLGMGGSTKHVTGYEGITSTHSRSSTPDLVSALLRGLEYDNARLVWYEDEHHENDAIFSAMAIAQHYLKPPTQQMEFFAKVLLHGKGHGVQSYLGLDNVDVVLATPLFVTLTHFPKDDHWGIIEPEK